MTSQGKDARGRTPIRILWILLVWATVSCSREKPIPAPPSPAAETVDARPVVPPPPPATRDPELRQIDEAADAIAIRRLEFIRARLPGEFRSRNNFAWAVAKIEGLDQVEFYAHSGIQDLTKLSEEAAREIATISTKPARGRFQTLCVNQGGVVGGADCWQRDVDTEYKILEDLAAHLPDTAAQGRIRLYTELYPCPSCWNVMKQFLAVYSNVQLQVLYRVP